MSPTPTSPFRSPPRTTGTGARWRRRRPRYSACLRRVRRLEAEGVITGYTAVVDPAKLGRGFEVLLHVDLAPMAFTAVEAFAQRIAAMDEVVGLRRMFGIPDYLIRLQIADMDAYERWLTTQLLGAPAIARAEPRMTMRLIKPAR